MSAKFKPLENLIKFVWIANYWIFLTLGSIPKSLKFTLIRITYALSPVCSSNLFRTHLYVQITGRDGIENVKGCAKSENEVSENQFWK
jgi:bacteriorhodopsin